MGTGTSIKKVGGGTSKEENKKSKSISGVNVSRTNPVGNKYRGQQED